ncbi:MAG: GNAT family N-acetyltransferase [Candidatus Eisenbacteria bacterium]
MPPEITIEAVSDLPRLKQLGGIWNGLLARSAVDNPYLTHEWFLSWWEAFGDKRDPLLLVAKRGKDIIGLAPLMRHSSFIPGCRTAGIEFAGAPDADYHDFIILEDREAVLGQFIRFIFETEHSPFLRLSELSEDSPNVEALNMILSRERSIRGRKRTIATCRYLPVDAGLSWEEQFRRVKRKMRGDIKRLLNRYGEIGGLTLTRIGAEEIAENLPHLYRHHVERLVHKRKQSILENPAHREFFSILGKRFASRGWLEFLRLDSDSDFVGIHYGFRYNGRAYCYQHGHNQALDRYSPGKMVLYHVVREAFANGLSMVDLLRGADAYKSHWTDLFRTNYEFTFFGKGRSALGFYIWFDKVKPCLQRIAPLRLLAARRRRLDR